MKKVLIVLGDENYILYTNSSRPEHLYEAIKKKRELYKVLSSDRKGHEFLVSLIEVFDTCLRRFKLLEQFNVL